MVFPYPQYYPNQKELIDFISSTCSKGMNPVFESPTGSGKTIAVLSALLPLSKSKGKRIIYLCRTHEQMDRVIEELRLIYRETGAKGLSLRSRRSLCLNEFVLENTRTTGEEGVACSMLKKEGKCEYYKNLSGPQKPVFNSPATGAEIKERCRAYRVCPYEFSKELIHECDVVACSYLYVFDPGIRASFLSSTGKSLEDCILVLDEAHNLPRLGIDIASDTLTEFAVKAALNETAENKLKEAGRFLESMHEFILGEDSSEKRLEKKDLLAYIDTSMSEIKALENRGDEIRLRKMANGKRPVSFLYTCASFAKTWIECPDEGYAFFSSRTENGMPRLEIHSMDASLVTKPPLRDAFLSVHMSGTLTPIKPYCEVVGLEQYVERTFPSPFPKENIATFVETSVSTLGSLRTEEMYKRILKRIEILLSIIPGNVLVFFPSYVVLQSVLEQDLITSKKVFIERRSSSSADNNEMISVFKASENAVLFGVQQGRNSEGQDFPGAQAEAVIVVGIPYAVRGPKIEAQIEYYKERYRGWWGSHPLGEYYAYFLPAYRSLNQAAGRAHRSISDRGVIVFLEKRVAHDKKVLANIAPWIKDNMQGSQDIMAGVREFYRSASNQ